MNEKYYFRPLSTSWAEASGPGSDCFWLISKLAPKDLGSAQTPWWVEEKRIGREALEEVVGAAWRETSITDMDPQQSVVFSGKRKKKGRNKRKRRDVAPPNNEENLTTSRKRQRGDAPLVGVLVAVSTLDVNGEAHSDVEASYRSVTESCRQAGATVTGQVHGRLSCLLCSTCAVRNLTQRVRKALKKNVPLVDIAWLHQCQSEGKRVDHEPYRLDKLGKEMLQNRTNEKKLEESMVNNEEDDTTEDLQEEGWSEPVHLGCCCVCHENGDDNCPWCTQCNVNRPASPG